MATEALKFPTSGVVADNVQVFRQGQPWKTLTTFYTFTQKLNKFFLFL